jgi:hypothetical protein
MMDGGLWVMWVVVTVTVTVMVTVTVTVGGCMYIGNFRLLLTKCCCGNKLFVNAQKGLWQIALCFTLKS